MTAVELQRKLDVKNRLVRDLTIELAHQKLVTADAYRELEDWDRSNRLVTQAGLLLEHVI